MKNHWWKILAVLLLLYAIIMGLFVPLKSGILGLTPREFKTDQKITTHVKTYNTDFTKGVDGSSIAYIKINDKFKLYADLVKVVDKNTLALDFTLPALLPSIQKKWPYTIVVNDKKHGAFVRPDAIVLEQAALNLDAAISNWPKQIEKQLLFPDELNFPFRPILYESIRNTFYHVPLWFGMVFLLFGSVIYSIKYLRKPNHNFDYRAKSLTSIAVLYGMLGCVTGAIWAKGTWGTWWTFEEIKLNVSAVAMLIYIAYFILRSALVDEEQRARVSAVYSIFAFVAVVLLLFVVPRIATNSLHPGNGGNPGFGGEDLDNTLRMVFYPAIIGWALLGFWLGQLHYRYSILAERLNDEFE